MDILERMLQEWYLDSAGLYDVPVVETRGELTDHYDPRSRVVRLSTWYISMDLVLQQQE